MFFGDINILVIFIFFIFGTILINVSTSLHLLLTAELLWITLYGLFLLAGLIYDNLNILSLTFFLLLFSALELGVGLVIILLQHLFLRTLTLNENDTNVYKFYNRYLKRFNLNTFYANSKL